MTKVRRAEIGRLVPANQIAQRLRAAGHTVGRTRLAVLHAVASRTSAFTADELAAAVPDVHIATVYRTLALLEEIGAVRHVHLSHGAAIYECAPGVEHSAPLRDERCALDAHSHGLGRTGARWQG